MPAPVPLGSPPPVRIMAEAGEARASLTVATAGGILGFRLDATGPRLHVGLVLVGRDRPVDVSDRPVIVVSEVRQTLDAGRTARWLSSFCAEHGLWAGGGDDLARGLSGASFPLLGALYHAGGATIDDLPRWASPVLAEGRLTDAARVAFGRASRRLVAALGRSLHATEQVGAPPNLLALALALMGRPVLAADATARVLLAGAGRFLADRSSWPTVDDIARFQLLAPELGARRVERILTETATLPDGARLFARTTLLLPGLPSGARLRLPMGLVALHERCRDLTPIDPGVHAPVRPLPGRRPVRPASVAAPRLRPVSQVPRQALRAPVETSRPPPAALIDHPSAVARLHGCVVGPRLRLVVPRSTDELRQWGQRLHNCLGSFAAAAASGRSVLVGVERDDVLAYCVELTPASRTVRQLLGPHNRSVPAPVAAAVVSTLVAAGLVDARHPVNRPWMALCDGGRAT